MMWVLPYAISLWPRSGRASTVIPAPLLDHEDARLDRLSSLGLLDTDPEPVFDAFAEAAVAVTG